MARAFPVSKALLRDAARAEDDAKCLDALCGLAREAIAGVLPAVFADQTASEAASASLEEARSALALFAEGAEREGVGADEALVLRELARELGRELPPLDPELVAERSSELARAMVSTWADLLRAAFGRGRLLVLGDDLLPHDLDDALLADWNEAIHPLGLDPGAAARVLSAVHRSLLANAPLRLPFGLELRPLEGGMLAVTAQASPASVLSELLDKLRDAIRGIPLPIPEPEPQVAFATSFERDAGWFYTRDLERQLGRVRGVAAVQVLVAPASEVLHVAYRMQSPSLADAGRIQEAFERRAASIGLEVKVVAVAELPREKLHRLVES